MRAYHAFIFAALLAGTIIPASAQQLPPAQIVVSAKASVSVANDSFSTSMNIESKQQFRTAGEAKAAGTAEVIKIKTSLEGFGLINNQNFSLGEVYTYSHYDDGRRVVTGYSYDFSVEVAFPFTQARADEIGAYVLKGQTGWSWSPLHSTVGKAGKKQALLDARKKLAAEARELAEAHAAGAECHLGVILKIEEGGGYGDDYGSRLSTRALSAPMNTVVSDTAAAGRVTEFSASAKYTFACTK